MISYSLYCLRTYKKMFSLSDHVASSLIGLSFLSLCLSSLCLCCYARREWFNNSAAPLFSPQHPGLCLTLRWPAIHTHDPRTQQHPLSCTVTQTPTLMWLHHFPFQHTEGKKKTTAFIFCSCSQIYLANDSFFAVFLFCSHLFTIKKINIFSSRFYIPHLQVQCVT